jgi:DNA-binding LacI/PurR family transcriptional regulator
MPPTRFKTRPPVKHDAIVRHLRSLVVAGGLQPGQRVPTRSEVEQHFGVSTMTVQRAFERMVAEGFLTVAGSSGTVVAANAPHLHRFVLSFPGRVGDDRWVRFWELLAAQAQGWGEGTRSRIDVAYGIDPALGAAEVAQLATEVGDHRVAGIFFASDPWTVVGTPLLDAPGIPRVAFSGLQRNTAVPGISLGADGRLLLGRAIERLQALGRRRLALITVPGLASPAFVELWRGLLAQHGLAYDPALVQVAEQKDPRWAGHLVLALFRGPAEQRPDGLLIADDNLVDHACAGLMQLGLRVPEDLDVVAHANFPLAAPAIMPVIRLGFDVPQAFALAMDILARQQRGEAVPPVTIVHPRFADEREQRNEGVSP